MSVDTGLDNVVSPSKPPKSSGRRKISLPWFRQSSFGERLTKLRLPRQHTVDCGSTATTANVVGHNNTPSPCSAVGSRSADNVVSAAAASAPATAGSRSSTPTSTVVVGGGGGGTRSASSLTSGFRWTARKSVSSSLEVKRIKFD